MLDKESRSFLSLAAPTKFDPLSENSSCGSPRREINRLRAAMKASVVRSETASRWSALLEKHKDANISFDKDWPSGMTFLQCEGSGEVHAGLAERRTWSYSLWW